MKRINGLWEEVIAVENLRLAVERASKGKKWRREVKELEERKEEKILQLHEMLREKRYRTSPYKVRTVRMKKERTLKILPLWPDRVVHHAVMNVMEAVWMKVLPYNTYSCIRGRGIHGCARRVEKVIRKYDGGELYCLKLDLKKYYENIDHEVLKKILRRKIKDKNLLWLLDDIVDSTEGLPIGNYSSPWLANMMLAYMMHWANEQLASEVQEELGMEEKPKLDSLEYADDIVVMSDSKEVLHEAWRRMRKYLEGRLRLRVKENWQIFPVAKNREDKRGRAVDYVGYQFFRNQKLLRKSIKKTLCREAARMKRRGNVTEREKRISLAPWWGWAKHCNSKNLIRKVIEA